MDGGGKWVSLRRQIVFIVILSWLVPTIMLFIMMLWNLGSAVGEGAKRNYTQQFAVHLNMCTDRLDSALEASRLASYDTTIRDAWHVYQSDGNYATLYRDTMRFLNRQYRADSRFRYAVFCFSEDPASMQINTTYSSLGEMYTSTSEWWKSDSAAALEMASSIDTGIGFLKCEDRVYLIRNVMDSNFRPIGVLSLCLNLPYYFDDLGALNWASPVEVVLGEDALIQLGEGDFEGSGIIATSVSGNGYSLSARASLLYDVLLAPVQSYMIALGLMMALLVPLLVITFAFFRRKVTRPMHYLVEGAGNIEHGLLGYQIEYSTSTSDFEYLIDSFNRMSSQLKSYFDRIYDEEVALRDAQIKALQAHINPHFLNNTLETINWEARIDGNGKVSRMIEALSTVLDAALDRKSSPEITLEEELRYVDAYLYIITQRFGDRLEITVDIPDSLKKEKVPRLILQPVIENAVEHGIQPSGKGWVGLSATKKDGFLILEVTNNGGLPKEDEEHIARLLSPETDKSRESSGNIGIVNVNARLKMLYGPESGLTIGRGEGSLVIARLYISGQKADNEVQ